MSTVGSESHTGVFLMDLKIYEENMSHKKQYKKLFEKKHLQLLHSYCDNTVGTICIFESEQTQSLNVTEAYSIDIFRVASGRIWHCSLVVVHYRHVTPHYSFSNLIVLSIDFPVLYTIVRTPSLHLKIGNYSKI